MQCLLEVVTINDELLWALLGAEDIHHLAKANHVHGHCSRAAAVDVGHLWKHQLLTLHTTCAHSFALDLTVLIVSPGTVHIQLPALIASPGIVCISLPMLNVSPGTVHSHATHNCRRDILAGLRNLYMEHNISQLKPPQTECRVNVGYYEFCTACYECKGCTNLFADQRLQTNGIGVPGPFCLSHDQSPAS